MSNGKPIVVAYDISKNKLRRRVHKILKNWRIDGQKSVHECRLSWHQAQELFIQLGDVVEKKTDSLMMAWIEPHRKVLHRGLGRDATSKTAWHIQ